MSHRSRYTGRWWVSCHIWYSEEGPGQAGAPPSPLLDVPNVTAHPSTASVPITVLLYDGPLLCGFNVAIKELNSTSPHIVSVWSVLSCYENWDDVPTMQSGRRRNCSRPLIWRYRERYPADQIRTMNSTPNHITSTNSCTPSVTTRASSIIIMTTILMIGIK